jgi:uncharacterized protein YacL
MIQAISRFVFIVGGLLGGYAVTQSVDWQAELGLDPTYVIFLLVILGAAIGFVLGGITGRELAAAWRRMEIRIAEVSGVEIALSTVGLLVGLLIAFFVAQPLRLLEPVWLAVIVSVVLSLVTGYLGVSIALTRRREATMLLPWLAPTASAKPDKRFIVLDTSAVIDGRFTALRDTGFLPDPLRVPRFVLAELQTLADSADDTRRARGRRGLDLLTALPDPESVGVMEIDYPEIAAVDEKLIRLAADSSASILTVDYNLMKVARVRGVHVLNLHELTSVLKPTFLPGDGIRLRVAKQGKERDQGVGYLEDGTMVVVQDGHALIGVDTDVEVTSVLQTSAGRMIFARAGADSFGDGQEATSA